MPATLIDGKAFAARVRAKVADHVTRLREETWAGAGSGRGPCGVKTQPAKSMSGPKGSRQPRPGNGIFRTLSWIAETSESDLLGDLIAKLNADPEVHGILVQLPLPAHLDSDLVDQTASTRPRMWMVFTFPMLGYWAPAKRAWCLARPLAV